MARIRSIHPSLFTGDAFMEATAENPMACLLLIGLWGQADDKGAFEWKPATLKARILPATSADGSALLEFLRRLDFIAPYEMNGVKYGAIRKFGQFQRPKAPNDLYPMPPDFRNYASSGTPITETAIAETKPIPPKAEPIPQKGEIALLMEDGGDKMEEIIPPLPPSPLPKPPAASKTGGRGLFDNRFEEFYRIYPRKKARGSAQKAWTGAIKKASPDAIIAALQAQTFSANTEMIPYPASWLNAERWRDEIDSSSDDMIEVDDNEDNKLPW